MPQVPTIQRQYARRLLLCRNGESMFPPTYWSYNNRTLKTWDKVCEDIAMKILPTRKNMWGHGGTGVRALCSVDGGTRITSIEQLHEFIEGEDNKVAVICGPEPWKDIDGGYESLVPEQKTPRDASKSQYQAPKPQQSFREINKKTYGNAERSENEKLHNRAKVAPVRKIFVRKNGDPRFQPKTYIWRLGQTSKLEHLKVELTKIAPPPHGNVKIIYDMKGNEITDENQIKEGQTYVAAADTQFDLGEDEQLTDEEDEKKSMKSGRPRSRSQNNKGNKNQGKYGKNGQNNEKEESLDERQKKWKNLTGDDLTDKEREEIDRRDREFLKQHLAKQRQKQRSQSAHIFNRKDQTNPDAYLIYAFRNGAGSEAQSVSFNRPQLQKGMNYVLEIIAKRFGINPKKLCAMDGREIKDVTELITRGSYVIIPLGEQFRDTWYFLPNQAIDTSENPEGDNDRIVGNEPDPEDYDDRRRRDSRTESDREDDSRRYAATPQPTRPSTNRKNRTNSNQRPQTQDGRRAQAKSRNVDTSYSRRGSSAEDLRRDKSLSTRR